MERYKSVKTASIYGIIGNIFLLIIKAFIGFITNSQAMIADSFNSAGDIFSSFMTFIGNKIASKPSDDDHNLGHGKAEYIFSMLISLAMIIMSLKIFYDSLLSIIKQKTYTYSNWLIIVCIVTILIKMALYIYTHKLSKKHNNLLIEANACDHKNDCIITFFNLISCLLATKNIFWVDGVVGVGISLWIFYTSYSLFKESYDILMDKSISEETRDKVLKIVKKHKQIKGMRHFNSTPVGYKYQISLTIFVDGNLTTYESHKIADKLEKEIIKEVEEIYLAVIHVNPDELKKKDKKDKKKN